MFKKKKKPIDTSATGQPVDMSEPDEDDTGEVPVAMPGEPDQDDMKAAKATPYFHPKPHKGKAKKHTRRH